MTTPTAWEDAVSVALLLALDPPRLGGVCLRSAPGLVRDRWLALLRAALPPGMALRRVPLGIGDDRLLGGLDLAATLASGAPVHTRGLLAEAAGGVLVLAMAERLTVATAARLAAALDSPDRCACIALDEGTEDEAPPIALRDRLAFPLDLGLIAPRDMTDPPDLFGLPAARRRLPGVRLDDAVLDALCATAQALGVASLRACLLAVDAARAAAALAGHDAVEEADAILAARLVLAPRATQLPTAEAPPPREETDPADTDGHQDEATQQAAPPQDEREPTKAEADRLQEILVQAAQAAIPGGLLASLARLEAGRARAGAGRAGAAQTSGLRGRPSGVRAAPPGGGVRLNILETIRAAAPWQTIRRAESPAAAARIHVRKADFRVTRLSERRPTTTIFVVDASGSSAFQRLAEAKGAVELLLADCYIRRDQVALFAFRGQGAQMLLPPTRSLVRAKRCLAGLPGGGGTPLAAGLDAGLMLAEATRRRGGTPTLVLLTDGRANVARDGTPGRARAMLDATETARRIGRAGLGALLVDIAPRPEPAARALAQSMGARYLPLPFADAAALSRAVAA
jgi:magnesium chelatase subunit D